MTQDEEAKLAANKAADEAKTAEIAARKAADDKTAAEDAKKAAVLALQKRRITIGALSVLAVFWLVGLGLMLVGSSAPAQIAGFWILIGGLISGGGYLAFRFARVVVGSAWPEFHGDRDIAVALAFMIAFLLAPATIGDLGNGAAGLMRGLIFESPYLAATLQKTDAAPAKLYNCVVDKEACQYANGKTGLKKDPSAQFTGIDLSWSSFAIILAVALVVARGLRGARRDFFKKLSAEGSGDNEPAAFAEDEGKKQPRFITQVLMNYPTWVAFCIYALILIPATYLAVGSLLYLRLDSPVANLPALTRELDEVERDAMLTPGVTLETQRLATDIDRVAPLLAPPPKRESDDPDLVMGRAALKKGVDYITVLTDGRPDYKEEALKQAARYKKSATSGQFEDFKAVQLAKYETSIRETRTRMRPCLEALAAVAKQIEPTRKADADAKAASAANATQKTEQNTAQATATAAAFTLQLDSLRLRMRESGGACQDKIEFPKAVAPIHLETDCNADDAKNCGKSRSQFPEVMYGWLAASTDATILIVGLVGFGLFGSAIRMMGRVDAPVVSAAAVLKAQDDAYMARQQVVAPAAARQTARAALDAQRRETSAAGAVFERTNDAVTANVKEIASADSALKTVQASEAVKAAAHDSADKEATAQQTAFAALPEADRTPELADKLKAAIVARDTAAAELANAKQATADAATALDALNKKKAELAETLEKARENFAAAQTKDRGLQQTWQDAEIAWRKADDAATTAEAYHQQLKSSLVADRSNIVVRRRRTTGDVEYTISGAPARVLVQGLGAAFTSFLAGQAGVHILTDGGRTNAYSLLLSCFVGAVFAEEIWRWARRYLPSERATAPQAPTGTTTPTTPATPSGPN